MKKTAPILVASGLATFDMTAPVTNGVYTLPYVVTTLDAAAVLGSTDPSNNLVDSLDMVNPALWFAFRERISQAPYANDLRRAVAAQPIDQFELVYINWVSDIIPLPKVARCVSSSDYLRHAWGLAATATTAGEQFIKVAVHGSQLTTTLNTTGYAVNDPVYMGSSGIISMTPDTTERIVGRVITVGTNALIRVDLSEPTRYAGQPQSGAWKAGDLAPKKVFTVAGTSGTQYVVRGWLRLTSGSGHVAGTDWVEMRTLTGT